MQPVGQEQGARGQLRQQLQGQRPFGLAGPPDGGGQRIVPAQFEQHAGGDFGEGGPPPPAPGLAGGGFALGRVGQTELGAIQRDQPPTAPESVGRSGDHGQGAQAQAH